MGNLISVIIPVYNVSDYLERCVDSAINQTYKNLEIILVDDGSTDNSPIICDNYAKKNENIKVYHKKNGGLSDARNYGLEKSKGEYIYFLDSDDWIEEDTIKNLYNALCDVKADVSIGKIYFCGKEEDLNKFTDINNYLMMNSVETITEMAKGDNFAFFAPNKLYKKILFKDIIFPIGKKYEDIYTIYKVVDRAKKIVYTPNAKYAYFQREDSITHLSFSRAQMDWVYAIKEVIDFSKKYNNSTLDKALLAQLMFASVSLLNKLNTSTSPNDNSFLNYEIMMKKIIRDNLLRYLFLFSNGKCSSAKYKVACLMIVFNYPLYKRLINKYL